MKTFSTSSNAKRNAIANIAKAEGREKAEVKAEINDLVTIEGNKEDGFFWRRIQKDASLAQPEVEIPTQEDLDSDVDEPVVGHYIHCPTCKVHLDNGVMVNAERLEEILGDDQYSSKEVELFAADVTHEFSCLGCGAQFGEETTLTVPEKKPAKKAKKAGAPRKNKSDVESPCRVVWDMAEKMKGEKRKDIIQACVDAGVNYYTARTQYQLWYAASKNSVKTDK